MEGVVDVETDLNGQKNSLLIALELFFEHLSPRALLSMTFLLAFSAGGLGGLGGLGQRHLQLRLQELLADAGAQRLGNDLQGKIGM